MTEPKSKSPAAAPQQFVLRDYRPDDFDRLWEIDQLCFAPGIAYTQMDLTGFLLKRGAIVLVAEHAPAAARQTEAASIAGYIVAHRRSQVGRILTIDIVPEARGFGLGTRLMQECEGRLQAAGCTQMLLETATNNDAALRLYSKLGYQILRTLPRYYASHSLDAYLMGKRL